LLGLIAQIPLIVVACRLWWIPLIAMGIAPLVILATAAEDVTRALPHALGPGKKPAFLDAAGSAGIHRRWRSRRNSPRSISICPRTPPCSVPGELFERRRQEVELVSLVQRLLDRGLLDRVGGPAALTDLYTYAPSPGHFRHHLQHVKDKYVLRSIIQNSNEAIARPTTRPTRSPQLLDSVEPESSPSARAAETNKSPTIKQSVKEVIDQFQATARRPKGCPGAPTGFEELDRMSSGLKPGEMFVVAARPSMGKTSFMMNIVEHICMDLRKPGWFSPVK
jgi:replicative DNA helicase